MAPADWDKLKPVAGVWAGAAAGGTIPAGRWRAGEGEEGSVCSFSRASGTGLTMNRRPAEWTTCAVALGEMSGMGTDLVGICCAISPAIWLFESLSRPFSSAFSITSLTCSMNDSLSLSRINSLWTMIWAISSGLSPSRSNLKVTIFLLCVSS